ncbi:MAG: NAD-dependent epimerase/dehydratase family protein, partial [Thermoplasmatota archaeon]
MKAFVTGGAGFIGSHLVDRLIEKGYSITVYDNLSSGKKDFIKNHLKNKDFRFVESDLLDFNRLKKEIKGHDIVFHIAANPFVRLGEIQTRLDLEQGPIATYNVLESMRHNKIKKIVFSSSSVVYAEVPNIPIPETYGPTLPISLYGAGKLASEG